jgi:2-amino-4-hydroxy-6-hydroxymethyldihydropteridine diphosphokinase
VLREPDLTLPHPHLFERAFVLLPLAEIAADRVIAGRRVGDALAGSDITGIDKLPPRQTEAPR